MPCTFQLLYHPMVPPVLGLFWSLGVCCECVSLCIRSNVLGGGGSGKTPNCFSPKCCTMFYCCATGRRQRCRVTKQFWSEAKIPSKRGFHRSTQHPSPPSTTHPTTTSTHITTSPLKTVTGIFFPTMGVKSMYPKNPDPSKVSILRTRAPAIQVQTLHWRVQGFLG